MADSFVSHPMFLAVELESSVDVSLRSDTNGESFTLGESVRDLLAVVPHGQLEQRFYEIGANGTLRVRDDVWEIIGAGGQHYSCGNVAPRVQQRSETGM